MGILKNKVGFAMLAVLLSTTLSLTTQTAFAEEPVPQPVGDAKAEETEPDPIKELEEARKTFLTAEETLSRKTAELEKNKLESTLSANDVRTATQSEMLVSRKAVLAQQMLGSLTRKAYMDVVTGGELQTLVGVATDGPTALFSLSSLRMAADRMGFSSLQEAEQAIVKYELAAEKTSAAQEKYKNTLAQIEVSEEELDAAILAREQAENNLETKEGLAERARATEICTQNNMIPGIEARAQYLYIMLRREGYSPQATAGILGNLEFDSLFDPTTMSQQSSAFGIGQWNRKTSWLKVKSFAKAEKLNPWQLPAQTKFLVKTLENNPGKFDKKIFSKMKDATRAAVYYHNTITQTPASESMVSATRGKKARAWFRLLKEIEPDTKPLGQPVAKEGVYCNIPSAFAPGGSLPPIPVGNCPPVTEEFKANFASNTGFSWDGMNRNAQIMSQCVAAFFPQITVQGTYNGHMPTWSQAIDFMMPSGCVDDAGGQRTTSPTDFAMGTNLTRYLFENLDTFGIDYMIWQDSIRNPGEHDGEEVWVPIEQWRNDTGNNGDCTNVHYDHVHVSVHADPVVPPPATTEE